MDDPADKETNHDQRQPLRCAECDSVIPADSDVCVMCGATIRAGEVASSDVDYEASSNAEETGDGPTSGIEQASERTDIPQRQESMETAGQFEQGPEPTISLEPLHPDVFESKLVERQSNVVFWMTGVAFVVTILLGSLVLQHSGPVQMALVPSATSLPATMTPTGSPTPAGTDTPAVTETPSVTPEPTVTNTAEPPRVHQVAEGETLFGLAYIYNVTMDAIADLNGFSTETPIQSGQTLEIPWPTATPPLEPVVVEINGEPVIADPTNCERYEIQEGDALSVIAARNNINFDLLLRVNRLTDQSVMQPGDTICIPDISYGQVLPPTPGPSPTPSPTSFPEGPALLYPTDGIIVDITDEPIVLQWLAVKDLAPDEWYMVELTDLAVEGQRPKRAFTRDNAFRVPGSWRPPVEAYHEFRWRVSLVRVTGQRSDGGFIYTFGGRFSEDGHFTWQGAVPTATPTVTPTATPEP